MRLFLKCQNNNSKVPADTCKGSSGCSTTAELGLIFRQLRNPPRRHIHYLPCARVQYRERARKKKTENEVDRQTLQFMKEEFSCWLGYYRFVMQL